MNILDPLYTGLAYLIIMPFLALIPVVFFALLFWKFHHKLCVAAAVLWLVYAIYETGMYLQILCGGECNIRVDLLLIYPLLVLMSVLAILQLLWQTWRKKH